MTSAGSSSARRYFSSFAICLARGGVLRKEGLRHASDPQLETVKLRRPAFLGEDDLHASAADVHDERRGAIEILDLGDAEMDEPGLLKPRDDAHA